MRNPIQLLRSPRSIMANETKATLLPCRLGLMSGVFQSRSVRAWDELILCESNHRALTFWVNGYRNVTRSTPQRSTTNYSTPLQSSRQSQGCDRLRQRRKRAPKLPKNTRRKRSPVLYRTLFPPGLTSCARTTSTNLRQHRRGQDGATFTLLGV